MLGVYASAAAILLASLVLGSALLHVLGRTAPTWLSGAVGFAALTVASPLLIRLPGRAVTLSILVTIAIIVAVVYLWRGEPAPGVGRLVGRSRRIRPRAGGTLGATAAHSRDSRRSEIRTAAIVALVVVAAASLPFAFNGRNGVLGEGIY